MLVLCWQPFNNWMEGAKEDLVDMFIVHTMSEIQVSYKLFMWHVLYYSLHVRTLFTGSNHLYAKIARVTTINVCVCSYFGF